MNRLTADDGGARRAAVFLDRDGTVIEDRHYLGDPAGVALLPGAAEAIREFNRVDLPVVLVTNQSGIGRGLFTHDDFLAVQRRLADLLAAEGARLDAVHHCPHSPEHDPPCECRKPLPGLFQRAAAELGLDLSRSFFVGDRPRDVAAASLFGGTGFLIRGGAGSGGDAEVERDGAGRGDPVHEVTGLAAAAAAILRQHAAD